MPFVEECSQINTCYYKKKIVGKIREIKASAPGMFFIIMLTMLVSIVSNLVRNHLNSDDENPVSKAVEEELALNNFIPLSSVDLLVLVTIVGSIILWLAIRLSLKPWIVQGMEIKKLFNLSCTERKMWFFKIAPENCECVRAKGNEGIVGEARIFINTPNSDIRDNIVPYIVRLILGGQK